MMVKNFLGEILQKSLKNAFSNAETHLTREIAYRTARFKRKIIKDIISLAIIFVSIIFLAISFTYLFIEYLSLTITISFLITGIVLLFIGLIIKILR